MRHKTPDLQALLDRFIAGYSDPQMHNYMNFLTWIVAELQPKHILEIGTGDGLAARMMMQTLPRDGSLVTVLTPGTPAEELTPWLSPPDRRLDIVRANEKLGRIDPADMLFIHRGRDCQTEWQACQDHLEDGAIVLVYRTMVVSPGWWNGLPYNKLDTPLNGEDGFGMFVYDRGRG